jgi:hypothetical protein
MSATGAFVLFLIFGGVGVLTPISRAISVRISGKDRHRDRVRELEQELAETSARLQRVETERDHALEKAEFMERLLAAPAPAVAKAPSGEPGPAPPPS